MSAGALCKSLSLSVRVHSQAECRHLSEGALNILSYVYGGSELSAGASHILSHVYRVIYLRVHPTYRHMFTGCRNLSDSAPHILSHVYMVSEFI